MYNTDNCGRTLKLRTGGSMGAGILKVLLKEQKEDDKKKLFEAYRKSKRSLDEVIDFMKGKADI